MSGGMRQGEQAKCPHCGVPLTGMNSNPDDCLQKPSEPAPSEEVRKLDPDEAFSEWYEYAKRQESRNGWSRQKLAARAFAAGRKFLASALRAERERVSRETLEEAAKAECWRCGIGQVPELRQDSTGHAYFRHLESGEHYVICDATRIRALAKKGLST